MRQLQCTPNSDPVGPDDADSGREDVASNMKGTLMRRSKFGAGRSKLWAVVAASVAVLLGLTGCTSSGGAPGPAGAAPGATSTGSGPSIWYLNPLESYDLYNQSATAFKDAAGKLGYKATVVGSTKVDIPEQITFIKQAIAANAKAIIFCDLDPKTYTSTIKQAQAKGIVMITTGGCVDNVSDYSVGTDNATFGHVAAQTIAKHVGKNAQVIVFGTNESIPNQAEQYKAFKAYAAVHYPNMKVLAFEPDNADAATAATKISAAVAAYPSANAYWFVEGAGLAAVPKALQQAGKKPGDIFVLGIDATPATLSALKTGWIPATLAQCYFWATPFAAQLGLAKLAGHGPKQRTWNVGVDPVTKANLPYSGCPASDIPKLPGQ